MQRIENECSLTGNDWFFYEIYYHEKNKMDLVTLKTKMSLPELLDYKESLDAMSLLQSAAEVDAKRSQSK